MSELMPGWIRLDPATTFVMTMNTVTRPSLLMLASLLGLAACDLGPKSIGLEPDTETGEADTGDVDEGADTTDDSTNDPVYGLCGDEAESIITDPQVIPPGFDMSVDDVLAHAFGAYQGSFVWNQNDGPVMVTHAGTSSPLTMSITYLGGEIRLTEVEFVGQFPNGNEGGEPCSNHLEIDMEFQFATEDGLFAETMMVPLDVYSDSIDPAPSVYLELNMDTNMGSLSMDDFSFTDATVEALILTARFPGLQSTGSLAMQVETMDWVGFGPVAAFTADRLEAP